MKLLIFGAAGFVGQNLVEKLDRGDIDIVASDFVDSPFSEKIDYKKVRITDEHEINKIMKDIDYVIHLAAHPLPLSLTNPLENAQVNIIGTLNILEAARKNDVKKIIFTSASSIIGDVKYNPVDEKHPCKPKTPYAASKYAIEHYLRIYQNLFGLDYLIFRLWNVYGPKQPPKSKALIPLVMSRMLKEENVFIFGDGSQTRDFIFVGDVVDFLIKSIKQDVKNDVVNLGSGESTTIKNVIDLIAETINVKPKIDKKPKRPGEITNFYADVTKLEKLFDSVPKTNLKDGLKETYEWLKNLV